MGSKVMATTLLKRGIYEKLVTEFQITSSKGNERFEDICLYTFFSQ